MSWSSYLSALGAADEKQVSPGLPQQHPTRLWLPSTHSLLSFSPTREVTAGSAAQCCLEGGIALAKFLFLSPVHPDSFVVVVSTAC